MAEKTGNRLTTFLPPAPSRALIAVTGPINRWLMLSGTPLLREIPLLGRLPGFTGLCDVRLIDLPRTSMMLAQGVGRLIRTREDRGVVAVFDPRLASAKRYRWDLISALPPFRRTRDRAEVEAFLRELTT